jgi:hypothetical protein
LAEVAHIRGRTTRSPRYDPTIGPHEVHHFDNLILLCQNCHHRVDRLEPDKYTSEVLTAMKQRQLERHAKPTFTELESAHYARLTLRDQFSITPATDDGSGSVGESQRVPLGTAEEHDVAMPITPSGGKPPRVVHVSDSDSATAVESESITAHTSDGEDVRGSDMALEGSSAEASSGRGGLDVSPTVHPPSVVQEPPPRDENTAPQDR